MALYFYFNETTGDLVYSDQSTYGADGYVSLGQQTNTNPSSSSGWVFYSYRADIRTVSKDPNISGRIDVLTGMFEMFKNYSFLTSIDLSGFDTSNVTVMDRTFYNCGALESLNLSGFDTSSVRNMDHMFYFCKALTSLDLSSFDTSNVTNMNNMLSGCNMLTSVDLSSFDTSNVTDMSSMFANCQALAYLDLSGFDTSNATNMSGMFSSCRALVALDLSSFDTSNATSVVNMFASCSSLRIIDISPNMSNVVSILPAASYYDAATRRSYAKGNIPGGSTYVRYIADLDLMATMVQTRMGINVAKHLAHRALNRTESIDVSGIRMNVVRKRLHQAKYDRDTLEIVTDSTGKVTEMWLVTAD